MRRRILALGCSKCTVRNFGKDHNGVTFHETPCKEVLAALHSTTLAVAFSASEDQKLSEFALDNDLPESYPEVFFLSPRPRKKKVTDEKPAASNTATPK